MNKYILIILLFSSFSTNAQLPQCKWAKSIGSISNSYEGINSVKADPSGNLYSTGYFSDTVDFDSDSGITNLISTGGMDIFVNKYDASGNLIWVKQMNGTSGVYDAGKSLALDNSQNIIFAGYFWGTVDFDPDTATANLSSVSNEASFICKLDSNGHYIWAGSIEDAIINSVAVDDNNNIYIIGTFRGTQDFDPGPGIFPLAVVGFGQDAFVCKLSSVGDLIWAKSFGGINDDYCYAIALDDSANIYTTGMFHDTTDFDPGPSVSNFVTDSSTYDIFLSKLDSSGNFIWAKQMKGILQYYNEGTSLSVDSFDNIYLAGDFGGVVDFDPGIGITNLSSLGGMDIFVSKLNREGELIWAKQIAGSYQYAGSASSIVADLNGHGIYITGSFEDSADFNPGTGNSFLTSGGDEDIFILKLDSGGNFEWVKKLSGINTEKSLGICQDYQQNIIVCGKFESSVMGIDTFNLLNVDQSGSITDGFIFKLENFTTSVSEWNLKQQYNIYPNPATLMFSISPFEINKHTSISIYDISGRLVYKPDASMGKNEIYIGNLPDGLYVVRIETENFIESHRLIIAR